MPEIPAPEDTIEAKFNALLERVKKFETADPLQNAVIHKGGIVIQEGGSVKVVDSNGNIVAIIGALPAFYNRADGSPQPGLALYREDGTPAVLLGDLNASVPPFKQAFQLFDRSSRVIFADDTNSGHGLATPHIVSSPLQDTNPATWPATTAATWTTIAQGIHEVQNPLLQWYIGLQADAGTTGQFRLTINGTQISTTQTVVGGVSGLVTYWAPGSVNLPAGVSVGDTPFVHIDAQRTAGTGTVRACCLWLSGAQS